jgi:hypothetical protein
MGFRYTPRSQRQINKWPTSAASSVSEILGPLPVVWAYSPDHNPVTFEGGTASNGQGDLTQEVASTSSHRSLGFHYYAIDAR